ncbi:Ferredoxin [Moritella viscosa]|uniref:ferredoxin-type protein NapF n=1 Tax=Moritella viscosa TaxID=80854 RepID=UPI00092316B1|nr:ferredoxin-type protein NapF [Moritella viscosa]SGZ07082.1 Ferredoxin [Moritella viscosa]
MSINLARRSLFRRKEQDNIVRLPWLKADLEFTDKCTRCGDCTAACPEKIIIVGDGGFPEIDFSVSECNFCKECVNHCKEDLFDLNQSQAWANKAVVSDRCLNIESVYCRSCTESCESEALAFNFINTTFVSPDVVFDDCNGCGACVSICPVSAITVSPDR